MASKEDLEEIIGEYSAKLGIPVPRIVWTKGIDLTTLSGELLYISAEAVESMLVNDLRVEVGYAYARRIQARFYLKVFFLALLALASALYMKTYGDNYARQHGVNFFTLVYYLMLLGCLVVNLLAYNIGNRHCDRIAYGLSRDIEGIKRFLATKGQQESHGKGAPLGPKALARRTAQLERYVQSQIVGESKP